MQHQILYLLMRQCGLRQVVVWVADGGTGLNATKVKNAYGNKVKLLVGEAELKAFLGAK